MMARVLTTEPRIPWHCSTRGGTVRAAAPFKLNPNPLHRDVDRNCPFSRVPQPLTRFRQRKTIQVRHLRSAVGAERMGLAGRRKQVPPRAGVESELRDGPPFS